MELRVDEVLDWLPPADDESLAFLDDVLPLAKPQTKPKRVRVNRMAAELLELRAAESHLEDEVARLRARRSCKASSKWHNLSIAQNALKRKALRENDELRAALTEQSAFRDYLERAFRRLPWSLHKQLQDTKWRDLTLDANADERIAAIHAIADRQYALLASEMIAAGLGRVVSEGIRSRTIQGAVATIAAAAHQTILDRRRLTATHGKRTTFHVDDDTTYIRDELVHPNGVIKVVSGMITKRYIHPTSGAVAIIWRSVLHDEAGPIEPGVFTNNEHGWVEYSPCSDGVTRYKAYLRATSPTPVDELDTLSNLVDMLRIDPAHRSTDVTIDGITETISKTFVSLFTQFEQEVHAKCAA
ncbi:hypothetical protein SPRG_05403 [Saprolegnia parasitica CBS 223.65]|uniref:Uncharacterized protein n=1 Tax=Saprolegnia parasitica (strain CBS 223.65) TaxID=695850 RepID=A0A067CEI9_SAPPC|nr:hypothetical protein SPRG_05403 [Saprolegnia parasitica CBS 223.65]KDO29159.1 hypothetical protein SPRG_05403 [Saprolegnia parasitica CBS 223.65]|eukprot:XP_012200038.1 hypothetical protein SPRG_05403 [Saprolegnia parasitica CBS 223.65]